MNAVAPIIVHVDPDIEDLIPDFLAHQQQTLDEMKDALRWRDLRRVMELAHPMKGAGGGYGFHGLTDLARALETTAREGDITAADRALVAIEEYLGNVEVRFDG